MQNEKNNTERVTLFSGIFLFRNAMGRKVTQKAAAGVLAATLLPYATGLAAMAQDQAPPPPPEDYAQQGPPPGSYQAASPEQLNQLVAPIALYPDSLVAQTLAAATYPAQVASAEQFVQQNNGAPPQQLAEMANSQPWDPSVKSLVAFPQVLGDLNQNMGWTTQLGNAYYNQPQDVMNAVQVMRQRAYSAGTLRPSSQLNVQYDPGAIVIAPVNPAVVYVPYYNPWGVYGAPVPVYGGYVWGHPAGIGFGAGLAIGFGVGIAIGAFAHFGWGYHNWAPDWHSRTVVFNHNTYISRSVTVVNHGYYGHFDRSPGARAFNAGQAARYGGGYGHTTVVNNVTINRGGNTYNNVNRTNNTVNRTNFNGGNTYNRGGNTYNNGGNTINRGGQTYNRGGQTFQDNHGGQQFNHGGQPQENHGGQQFNRQAPSGGHPAQFNAGHQGGENHGGGFHEAPHGGGGEHHGR